MHDLGPEILIVSFQFRSDTLYGGVFREMSHENGIITRRVFGAVKLILFCSDSLEKEDRLKDEIEDTKHVQGHDHVC
jgi:hypothetical protein